jgi:hypothetical protein
MDKKFVRILLTVGLLALLPLIVSAVTVTISPDRVAPGEQVTVTYEDLPDNARVSIEIAATFSAVPGGPFLFETSNFNIPFALSNGTISATLQNTAKNNIAVRQGDAEVKFSGDSVNGMYSKSFPFNVGAGTYDYIRLSGTASGDTVLSNVRLSGTKTGPSSGEIRFNVAGAGNGEVAITMRVNDTEVIAKTVVIASEQTTVPTNEPTPETTQDGNTGGSSGGSSGSSSTPATTVTTAVSSTEIATTVTTQATLTTGNTTSPTTVPVTTTAAATPTPTKTKAGPGLLVIPAGLAAAFLLYRKR